MAKEEQGCLRVRETRRLQSSGSWAKLLRWRGTYASPWGPRIVGRELAQLRALTSSPANPLPPQTHFRAERDPLGDRGGRDEVLEAGEL